MSCRMKSKSGWLADGKPTSISLKPISTTVSNMRRLRAGSIGSMSAWLPSRRSTEHHSGAFVIRWSGQVRSGSESGRNGRYLSKGIVFGVTGSGGIGVPRGRGGGCGRCGRAKKNLLPSAGGRQGERRDGALAYISRRRSEAKVLVMPGHLPAALASRQGDYRQRGDPTAVPHRAAAGVGGRHRLRAHEAPRQPVPATRPPRARPSPGRASTSDPTAAAPPIARAIPDPEAPDAEGADHRGGLGRAHRRRLPHQPPGEGEDGLEDLPPAGDGELRAHQPGPLLRRRRRKPRPTACEPPSAERCEPSATDAPRRTLDATPGQGADRSLHVVGHGTVGWPSP